MNLDSIQTNAMYSLPYSDTGMLISASLRYLFGAAGIILIIMIITAGYQMMISQGEPKAIQAAQAKLTNAILGIVIIFISFFLVPLILSFFGLKIEIIN